jgi:hypothetical protein
MATLAGIDAVNEKYFCQSAVDNAFLSNATTMKLWRDRRVITGGTEIVQPVVLTIPQAVTSYAGADMLPIIYDQNLYGAEGLWANYAATISITGDTDYKNMGDTAVINMLETQCSLADMALRQFLGVDIQGSGAATATSPRPLVGLAAAIDNGTVATNYLNISRNTYTNWKAVVNNPAANRPVSLDLLNTVAWQATIDNDRPNLYITAPAVIAKYTTLLQAQQRFQYDSKLADAGFSNIMFHNRPMIMDSNVVTTPGYRIWGLNTRYLHLYVASARAFRYIPFQTAINQDAATAKILAAVSLICSQPRLQLLLGGLDPSM